MAPRRVLRNPGSSWLVTLKSGALSDWIEQNEPRLLKTALSVFDTVYSYGFDAPAVDRSFVVSASDRREAIQRGMSEFNAAAAKSYSPLSAAAVERVDPGPVYLAEIIQNETGETNYLPFTQGTMKDVEAFVRKWISSDPSEVTVQAAAYSRSPAVLARSFVPGTQEFNALAAYATGQQATGEASMEDDFLASMDAIPDVHSEYAEQEFMRGRSTPKMEEAFLLARAQDYEDALLEKRDRERRRGLGSLRLESLSADLAPVKATRRLTNGRGGRRR